MILEEEKQLKYEIQHIFDSGANEIRILEMVKLFIINRDVTSGLSIQPVSKSLNDLKKLLAEMTIELITTEKECKERHLLIRNIEEAKESLKVLNNVC
tara:strand:- start:7450 stop:7743 length:294 start_codon:yes stop_codon:yes gene_type:complete